MKRALCILGLAAAIGLIGCSTDVGKANEEKVDKEKAVGVQPGKGGSKAAMGGGLADDPVAAAPGEKTGMPGPGAKAGGG